MESKLSKITKKISISFGVILFIHSNCYGMQPTPKKNRGNFSFFVNIPLAQAKVQEKSFPAKIEEDYFNRFNQTHFLQYFRQEDRLHITLFSGRAYPVTCTSNTCVVSEQLHHEGDPAVLRKEIGGIFKNNASFIQNLIVDPNLLLWHSKEEYFEGQDFYKSYLVLNLDNVTQNNLFHLQRTFFQELKRKLSFEKIEGGKVKEQEYGFYLQGDVEKNKSTFSCKKNESAVMCLESNERCYLITTNEYYRTPLNAHNVPINANPNNYHITLSDSDNYKKPPINIEGREYFNTEDLEKRINFHKGLIECNLHLIHPGENVPKTLESNNTIVIVRKNGSYGIVKFNKKDNEVLYTNEELTNSLDSLFEKHGSEKNVTIKWTDPIIKNIIKLGYKTIYDINTFQSDKGWGCKSEKENTFLSLLNKMLESIKDNKPQELYNNIKALEQLHKEECLGSYKIVPENKKLPKDIEVLKNHIYVKEADRKLEYKVIPLASFEEQEVSSEEDPDFDLFGNSNLGENEEPKTRKAPEDKVHKNQEHKKKVYTGKIDIDINLKKYPLNIESLEDKIFFHQHEILKGISSKGIISSGRTFNDTPLGEWLSREGVEFCANPQSYTFNIKDLKEPWLLKSTENNKKYLLKEEYEGIEEEVKLWDYENNTSKIIILFNESSIVSEEQ